MSSDKAAGGSTASFAFEAVFIVIGECNFRTTYRPAPERDTLSGIAQQPLALSKVFATKCFCPAA
jgi:hypothetical protein